MIVAWAFGMDMYTVTQRMDMLVKGRFEPDFAECTTGEPMRRKHAHFPDDSARVDVGGAEYFKRSSGAPAL